MTSSLRGILPLPDGQADQLVMGGVTPTGPQHDLCKCSPVMLSWRQGVTGVISRRLVESPCPPIIMGGFFDLLAMNDIEIEVPRAPRGIERLGIHAQHNFDAAGMALAIIEAVSKSPQSEEDLKETVKGAVSLFKEAIESL